MSRLIPFVLLLASLTVLPATARAGDSLVSFTTTPPAVTIDALYNGTDIKVAGQVPAGA